MLKLSYTYLRWYLMKLRSTKNKGFTTKAVTSIQNLVGDRCATQKKIEIFTKYKKELLLRVTKTCHKLPKEYQQALGNVNEFFVAYIF